MQKLLQEISVIPGVTGSCIFDKSEGALHKDFNPELSDEHIETIGVHLIRLMQMGKMIDLQAKAVHFRYDICTVVGLPLDSGSVVITICDSQANCSLVATTAAMLVSDMQSTPEKKGEDLSEEAIVEEEADPEEHIAEQPDEDGIEELIAKVEKALTAAIGPVAGIVMHDYVAKWRSAGPAASSRLMELADMLEEEIGDSALAREFSSKIEQLT